MCCVVFVLHDDLESLFPERVYAFGTGSGCKYCPVDDELKTQVQEMFEDDPYQFYLSWVGNPTRPSSWASSFCTAFFIHFFKTSSLAQGTVASCAYWELLLLLVLLLLGGRHQYLNRRQAPTLSDVRGGELGDHHGVTGGDLGIGGEELVAGGDVEVVRRGAD